MVTNNPNFDCLVGSSTPNTQAFELSPNPTHGPVLLRLQAPLQQRAMIHVWDANGRMVQSIGANAGTAIISLELGHLSPGVYAVEVIADGFHGLGRVIRM
jgi:hypothetical protein